MENNEPYTNIGSDLQPESTGWLFKSPLAGDGGILWRPHYRLYSLFCDQCLMSVEPKRSRQAVDKAGQTVNQSYRVLIHDRLLHEMIKGRMRGKPTRGRNIQMLHDLALKWAAEDRGIETQRKDVKNQFYSRRLLTNVTVAMCYKLSSISFWGLKAAGREMSM